MILSCNNIKKSFGVDEILTQVTFHLNTYDKVALVGINGAGKTTLMRILMGDLSTDEGNLYIHQDASVGYLAQETDMTATGTIFDECEHVFEHVIRTEQELRQMESTMKNTEGEALTQLMTDYAALQEAYEQMNGYGYKSQILGVLKGLGFESSDLDKTINTLSGGQKSRVMLAKLLLRQPSILLLDEPTNHLDIDAVTWLEDYLKNYKGTILLISHDRYFLDKIVTKVIEIENKRSKVYQGNYSQYASQKSVNREIEIKHYISQQEEIKRQEAIITKLRSFNREKSIKRAKSREKALEKVDRIDKPLSIKDDMNLAFQPKNISGNDVLQVEGLKKSYDHLLFENLDMDIKRGDKIALIGANGIGKTTLFKIIMKQVTSDEGYITYGSRVHMGYYDQEHHSLSDSKTIFEEISDTYPTMTNGEIRNTMAAFLFTGDDVYKIIGTLSGGEKARVSLAKIMLSESNFLLMDEPTNHLDIVSREVLENALAQYEGTLLFISHDRYFINRIATKVQHMTQESLTTYLGDYNDYVSKKQQLEKERLEKIEQSTSSMVSSNTTQTKLDWQEQKKMQTALRKLKKQLEACEVTISETEDIISQIDEDLCLEENYTDAGKAASLHQSKVEAETKLEELYATWEALQVEIESFE